jgi:adenylyl cyclase-associated protein
MKALGGLVRRNEWEKHTKTLSEGVGCLNWLVVKPAPRDFIESFIGGSDYWANGIRKEFRTTNADQIAFCDSFKSLIVQLISYVKDHHMTGLTWNPKGVAVTEFNPDSVAPASVGSAPAPAAAAVALKAVAAAPTADLFSALNKDSAITSGLKKVTKDMQTWRPEFKDGSAAPAPVAKKVIAPRVNNDVVPIDTIIVYVLLVALH